MCKNIKIHLQRWFYAVLLKTSKRASKSAKMQIEIFQIILRLRAMTIKSPLLFTSGVMIVLAIVVWFVGGSPRFANGFPVASFIGFLGSCFAVASYFLEPHEGKENKCD